MSNEQLFVNSAIMDYARVASTTGQMTKARGGASMSFIITNSPRKNTSGIYAIVNKANGKMYIGSSRDIGGRWKRHAKLLESDKHHSPHLQHAWNAYGSGCFDFAVLLECAPAELVSNEQRFIDELSPEYNVTPTAGSVAGVIRSEEYRRKQSQSQSGKAMSEETRRKISDGMRGKRNSAGIHHIQSQETKDKIRAKLLGHVVSDETREKIGAGNSGHTHTPEAKDRISRSLVGNKRAARKGKA